ncbi:MAG: methylated-DNA--[protein]-cysteine S-methyltransferase [Planctomycetes bacterium]|nr:methylated-DNA--[protein]-cysteine S-methyltransferase [Planctomycetota bacterium]
MTASPDKRLFFSVWSTAWGPMGGVADGGGLVRLVLPHYQADQLAELLAWEHAGAARSDEPFRRIIELSRAYFRGEAVEFDDVPLVLPPERTFDGRVYRRCRLVPYGRTVAYGELARSMGRPDAARAVAASLGRNPLPLVVPCHRVTYADGRAGGFSAAGGPQLKQRMIALEARRTSRPVG